MAQIFERGKCYYARFRHNGKDYCRSTGVKVPGRRASKDDKLAAKDKAHARLDAMLAEVRGRESIEELFDRLLEALERLPKADRSRKKITLAEKGVMTYQRDAWKLDFYRNNALRKLRTQNGLRHGE